MIILGLNNAYHDTSACILIDGKLVVALEEERFTRQKHTWTFPHNAISKCLQIAGIRTSDIDYIAVSIKPELHWSSKVLYLLKNLEGAKTFINHELLKTVNRQRNFWDWYKGIWKKKENGPKVVFVPHHLCHAAGTFFISPYETAAILSLDGAGEWSTSMIGHGKMNDVEIYSESFFPHSLGSFYEAATEFCGFRPNYDEGKTMGLAPLGDHIPYYDTVDKIVNVDDKGVINIDLSYFSYQYWGAKRCGEKFHKTFGKPRNKKDEFGENHINVAAAFQKVLEDKVVKICNQIHERFHEDYLVISGGVSLNSVMNGKIIRETPFKDVYVMPAAGDNGTSIGAAYYLYNGILKKPRNYVHDDPYLGTEYSNEEIRKVLDEAKLSYEYIENVAERGAEILNAGEILGWFQGRMEIGPRALGNRSILADPTRPHMKDKINAEVKHREAYRPFAPSAITESRSKYFDISVEAPFMLKVCDVLPEMRSVLPAITHYDGSARLQTVNNVTNPLYHQIISELGKLNGVPVVLNTSFNVMGEPVVESPLHAVRCFFSTGLDKLIIGNYLVAKNKT